MADTVTPNMGLTKPEIGGSANSWGNKLNINMDLIDSKVVRNTIQWHIQMGDEVPESGAGPFVLSRYNNSAVKIDEPLVINRQTGNVTMPKTLTVGYIEGNSYPYKSAAPVPPPGAGEAKIFFNAQGIPIIQRSDGSTEFLGTPPGTIAFTGSDTADVGWALLHGQAINRLQNPTVFAKFGTKFGIGDGINTFNLPDVRGRVIAGKDDMGGISANRLTGLAGGINGDILGEAGVGGAESHILAIAEIPAHNHGGTAGTPVITGSAGGNALKYNDSLVLGGGGTNRVIHGNASGDGLVAFTSSATVIPSQGGGQPHNNVQPTIILNAQVKLG